MKNCIQFSDFHPRLRPDNAHIPIRFKTLDWRMDCDCLSPAQQPICPDATTRRPLSFFFLVFFSEMEIGAYTQVSSYNTVYYTSSCKGLSKLIQDKSRTSTRVAKCSLFLPTDKQNAYTLHGLHSLPRRYLPR